MALTPSWKPGSALLRPIDAAHENAPDRLRWLFARPFAVAFFVGVLALAAVAAWTAIHAGWTAATALGEGVDPQSLARLVLSAMVVVPVAAVFIAGVHAHRPGAGTRAAKHGAGRARERTTDDD